MRLAEWVVDLELSMFRGLWGKGGEVGEGGVRRTGAWFPNQSVADHDHLRPAAFRPLHEAISSRSVP